MHINFKLIWFTDMTDTKRRKIKMFFGINTIKNIILHASATSVKNFIKNVSLNIRSYVRRTFLFSSPDASLTLEAALVLPVYIFFIVSLIYILNILNLQNSLQAAMEEASRNINLYAYIGEKFNDLDTFDKSLIITNEEDFADRSIQAVINTALIKKAFITDNVKALADNSYIINGSNGIRFFLSSVSTSHFIDFNIQYYIKLPFFPENFIKLKINQRCFFRTFTGEDISLKSGSFTLYAYIAPTGNVYHTSPYCSYLSKYYSILPSSYFDENTNNLGEYNPCSHCAKHSSPSPNAFLCAGSKVYHNSIDCFYLNAHIYKVTLDSVEDTMPLCTRCKKGVN